MKAQNWKFSTADIASMRFGYGIDILRPNPTSKADILNHIRNPERFPPSLQQRPTLEQRLAQIEGLKKDLKILKKDASVSEKDVARANKKVRNFVSQELIKDAHARFNSAVESRTPFFERLVFFWADHFSVSAKNNGVRIVAFDYEQTAIRPHVDGYFYDMLRAVIGHPAMLRFLDNHISVGPDSKYVYNRKRTNKPLGRLKGLNENLGRELLELHTLGVQGGYTQSDVTNAGQLLSGWSVDKHHKFIFRPEYAQPSPSKILGKSYGGADVGIQHMEGLLRDLSIHPKTAEFIGYKLAKHFISDHPPTRVVQNLKQVFLNTKGHLPSVYEALVNSPEAWETFGQKTKRPFDYLVSGIKAIGYPVDKLQPEKAKDGRVKNNRFSVGALIPLNQILYHVPGPNGWSDMAQDWITPQGITYRILWTTKISRSSVRKGGYFHRDKKNTRLFSAIRCCMGDAPPVYSKGLVKNAPTKQESVGLALINPAFLRR